MVCARWQKERELQEKKRDHGELCGWWAAIKTYWQSKISDLFFRKSNLVAVKKNDYILNSFVNHNDYTTFFIGLKASSRCRSWTRCLISPLTFWALASILSFPSELDNSCSCPTQSWIRVPSFPDSAHYKPTPFTVCTYSILYFPSIFTPWHCHLDLTMDDILKSMW